MAQRTSGSPSRLRLGLTIAALGVTALIFWGGYGHHWPWTGINGHTATLWDWLHLLLLPLLLPIVVVPALKPLASAKLVPVRGEQARGEMGYQAQGEASTDEAGGEASADDAGMSASEPAIG